MFILGGLVLLGVGVAGVWWTVTKTDYLPKLVVYLIKQAIPIIMKRKSPELEAKWRQVTKEAEEWDNLNNRPKRDEH